MAETGIQVASKIADGVLTMVEKKVEENRLTLPQNYSVGNALKQAQLAIQDDSKAMSCTQASIMKSMLDYAVLGLNVSKAQAYFIAYGNKLQLQVSYQGKKAIAMRIDQNIKDITSGVIRKGEEFVFEDMLDGYSKIVKHQRTLESMDSDEIIGGYATILYKDGTSKSLIMTYARIKKSWGMSKMNPVDEKGNVKKTSVHGKFTDEMIGKTVITAICKPIINSSSDENLFSQTVQAQELEESKQFAQEEIQENANNGDIIDIVEEEIEEAETVEEVIEDGEYTEVE